MENKKINIAELLKDCPKGMELDCKICNGVKFIELDRNPNFPIVVRTNNGYEFTLTKYGQVHNIDDAKCVIFPKGKSTWEGFVPPFSFKDGDIVATDDGWIGITTGGKIGEFIPTYCVIKHVDEFEAYLDRKETWMFHRLATEEEKEKLFKAIKDNGYAWNTEIKTLKKLIKPNFKVGDRIKLKNNNGTTDIIIGIEDNRYVLSYCDQNYLDFKYQDNFELVPYKFNITTLVPFESRVLMRSSNAREWVATFYSHYSNNKFYGCGMCCDQCIPYEENQHLLGTTNDCDEFYKNWK